MSLGALLKTTRLFSNMTDTDLHRIEASMLRRRYASGQVIFHMGDDAGSLYIIARGQVKVVISSPRGEEVILAILSTGEILGELSLIDGKPRSASAQAIAETEIFCLPRDAFYSFLRSRFEAVLQVLVVISQRLREADVSLADAHFLNLRPRLAKNTENLARVFGIWEGNTVRIGVKLTQKDLASMVGATRESVNKQLMQLRQRDLVQLQDSYITILDPVRLASCACKDISDMLPIANRATASSVST